MNTYPASRKQITYINQLISEAESMGERVPDDITDMLERGHIIKAEASMLISDLKELLGWEE